MQKLENLTKKELIEIIKKQELVLKSSGSIDRVTTTNLDIAFRMVGIECDISTTDHLIDLFELMEKKGDLVTMKDIFDLQNEWV